MKYNFIICALMGYLTSEQVLAVQLNKKKHTETAPTNAEVKPLFNLSDFNSKLHAAAD